MNILVTMPNAKHSLGIVRHLGLSGYPPYVLSFRKNSLCSKSKYCRGEIPCVSYDDKDFKGRLLEIIDEFMIELIIPVGTDCYKAILCVRKHFRRKVAVVAVDYRTLCMAMSKRSTYGFAASIGVPVPESYYPESFTDVVRIGEEVAYPCVIKPSREMGGTFVNYAYDKVQLLKRYRAMCQELGLCAGQEWPLIQEYVPGDGYGFFAVYNRGKCGPTFQHRRIREFPPTGGVSVCSESFRNEHVRIYGKKLLDALKWHGVAMVEFRMQRGGYPVLMEINPKFWGSCDLALEAGVNFPLELIEIAAGMAPAYSEQYEYPFRYHWPLHGDLDHAILKPTNFVSFLKDCADRRVRSNLWVRDDRRATLEIAVRYLTGKLKRTAKLMMPQKVRTVIGR